MHQCELGRRPSRCLVGIVIEATALGLLGLLLQHVLLEGSVDVYIIIRLFALVRLRFVALMLVNLFLRRLLELSSGSTARMVGTTCAHIATAGVLTWSILDVCLAARRTQSIVGDDAVIQADGIDFTLLVFRLLVALLRAEIYEILCLLLLHHGV